MSKKINWSALIPTILLLGVVISPPSIADNTPDTQEIENTNLPDYICAKVDLKITRDLSLEVIKGWHDFYAYTRKIFTNLLLEQYFKETNNTVPWIRWHPYISFIYKSFGNITGTITDFRGPHNISTNLSFYIDGFRGLHVIYPNDENRLFGYCLSFDFYEPSSGGDEIGFNGYLHAFNDVESNSAPNPPVITGSAQAQPRRILKFYFMTEDDDINPISLFIDWGDGETTGWTREFASGENAGFKKTYTFWGTYSIRAKARDVFGEESDWGYWTVKVPYNYHYPAFSWLMERFPLLSRLLYQWGGLE